MTQPEIRIELKASANGFLGIGDVAAIEKEPAELDGSVGKSVAAEFEGAAEKSFGVGAIAESEMSDGELEGNFVVGGSEREGLLKIGDGCSRVLLLIQLSFAGIHQFAGFEGHGKFVDGDGGGLRRVLFVDGERPEVDDKTMIGNDGYIDGRGEGLVAGYVDGDFVNGAA